MKFTLKEISNQHTNDLPKEIDICTLEELLNIMHEYEEDIIIIKDENVIYVYNDYCE